MRAFYRASRCGASTVPRSSPRKRGPRAKFEALPWWLWIPACARMTGEGLAQPQLRQRPVLAVHWIAIRQWHLGNQHERLGAFGRVVAAAQIISALRRVGADHQQVLAGDEPLMAGA